MNGQAAIMKTGMDSGGKPVREFTGRSMLIWLGAFFGVMFVANAFFVYFALTSWTGLEVESSYKAGQGYQQELDAAHLQASLGWQIEADVKRSVDGHTQVRIKALDKAGAPLTGVPMIATLHRPTHRAEDRDVVLIETEPGVYAGSLAGLAAGQWDLQIAVRDGDTVQFRSKNRVFLSE